MKRLPSTILILLILAGLAAPVQGSTVATSSKSTKKTLKSKKSAVASAAQTRVQKTIAAAKNSAGKKDPDLLYNARNAEYVKSGTSFFNFGPKSENIKYDKRMIMAAEIASERAHKHSTMRCWAYVKNALLFANVVSSRPTTGYAKQAGEELVSKYGFTKLPITDPYAAPLGAVLVYGGKGAGHVEIRTTDGFVSDFTTKNASHRPLLGVYVKPS
ncbi:MAG TPA: hypothetical protein VG733_19910 [Chthoniobacteraceae bacterium]|nr:hypothetical protein [Chthoniobacteraceae bacterium]